jgi:hypothetical protein
MKTKKSVKQDVVAVKTIKPQSTQPLPIINIETYIKQYTKGDAGASPTHQASQRGSGRQLDKPAQILKMLWNCCANLK